MAWSILADLVLALHASWVLAVVLGPLWSFKRPPWRIVHLGMMGLTLALLGLTGGCPLTDLENHFLRRSDPSAAYSGGFIAHALARIVYWDLPPGAIGLASSFWFLVWGGIYLRLWLRERRRA